MMKEWDDLHRSLITVKIIKEIIEFFYDRGDCWKQIENNHLKDEVEDGTIRVKRIIG
jgi:hypothetical protein